jgi:TrpR-related protein YerC/YecD
MVTTADWENEQTDALFAAVLTLRNRREAADFFRDLCTLQEIEALAQRWAVVRLLEEGIPYREIAQTTGAATATITRINQWLQHGTGGYRRALQRLKTRR